MNPHESTPKRRLKILLADDDEDDCFLFEEALVELPLQTALTSVHDGDQLIKLLNENTKETYDVLFLDINMPRKNGVECLEEIKRNENLKSTPVFIFSTSYDQGMADKLCKKGARKFLPKPADFSVLKKIIHEELLLVTEK